MTEIHKPGNGAIFGIVTEEGLAKDNSPVYLYDMRRWEGVGEKRLLARRFTRPDGGFEFAGLNTNYGDYMVMATDEDGETPKNALVQDRVSPVPAHSGSGHSAEWYLRAMQAGAQVGFIASPVHEDGTLPIALRGFFGRPVEDKANPANWPPNPAAPPEIPLLAAMQLNPLGRGIYCAGRMHPSGETPASIEVIIDLDSLTTQTVPCIVVPIDTAGTADLSTYTAVNTVVVSHSSARNSLSRLYAEFSNTKLLTIGYSGFNNQRRPWTTALTTIGSVDLAAYSGVKHIIISFSPTSKVQVFVDGVLAGEVVTALAGSAQHLNVVGYTVMAVITSYDTATTAVVDADPIISLAVYYNKTLTAQQALNHYKALYDNDLISIVSGYAREIVKDEPHMYWGMDDFDPIERHYFASTVGGVDPLSGSPDLYQRLNIVGNAASIDPLVPSPIAGRMSAGVVQANGNYFEGMNAGTHGWLFRDRGAVSCWVKFDLAAPAVNEFVTEITVRNSTTPYFEISRTTDNALSIRIWEAGAVTTYTFTEYTPPEGAWVHIAIVIDKTGEENAEYGLIKLYAGTESTAPVLVQTILTSLGSLYTVDSFATETLGALPLRVRTMRQLTGSMCELAVFPDILTPARIEAHWNMRTVV